MKTTVKFSVGKAIGTGLLCFCLNMATSQNVAITDDNSYTAHSTAMLDVKSISKGLLLPRLTMAQRDAITSPASGLMIFQTDNTAGVYVYESSWKLLGDNLGDHTATENIRLNGNWISNDGGNEGITVDSDGNVGVATNSPNALFHVAVDNGAVPTLGSNTAALFSNSSTNQDDVAISLISGKGMWGTCSVFFGDPDNASAGSLSYFNNNADPTTEFMNFAVNTSEKMRIQANGYMGIGTTNPSALLSIQAASGSSDNDTLLLVKDKEGNNVFLVYPDAVEVIVPPQAKKGDKSNKRGSFVVSGRGGSKGSEINFVDITKENCFIGHEAGLNTSPSGSSDGQFNAFLGYQAGRTQTTGKYNTFIGYQSGYSTTTGRRNVFIGYQSGFANQGGVSTASYNVFVGSDAGTNNTTGGYNTFLGMESGYGNTTGLQNVYVGYNSGYYKTTVNNNVFLGPYSGYGYGGITTGEGNVAIGFEAGYYVTGNYNVFLGYSAGRSETGSHKLYIANTSTPNPLIYGEFNTPLIKFNASVYMPDVYDDLITTSYRDLYIKSDGQLGYISSSKRYKNNIQDMENIEWIYDLHPVNFSYKSDSTCTKQYGLIAEEVELANKQFVSYNQAGMPETVLYSQLITPMLKALQEQKDQIDKKNKEIEDLKDRLEKIEQLLSISTNID
jgi:hypothetical protein